MPWCTEQALDIEKTSGGITPHMYTGDHAHQVFGDVPPSGGNNSTPGINLLSSRISIRPVKGLGIGLETSRSGSRDHHDDHCLARSSSPYSSLPNTGTSPNEQSAGQIVPLLISRVTFGKIGWCATGQMGRVQV
jgi:hypothetical protein